MSGDGRADPVSPLGGTAPDGTDCPFRVGPWLPPPELPGPLLAGVPLVVVPGGGDQWEMANRVVRQGSARLIRPLTADALVVAVNEVLSSPGYRTAAENAAASGAGVADPVRVCHEALALTG